jgi:hypothetical protein
VRLNDDEVDLEKAILELEMKKILEVEAEVKLEVEKQVLEVEM